jgi:sugar lactone lactonase YvrE
LEFDGDRVETCDFCGSKVIMSPNEVRNETSFGFGELLGQAQKLKEVLRLARSGNKIAAIKLYRETFGVGLAEAKDAVERLERGESVNFHNVNFQSYTEQINTGAVLKTAKVAGGSFAATFIIGIILIFGVTLAVVWLVTRAGDKQQTKASPTPAPVSPAVAKTMEQRQFAGEALKFGGEGVGAGMFKDNRVIAVDPNGRIYSADYTGGKIQVFDAAGKFLTQWMTDPQTTLHAMAADRKGNLYLQQSSDIHMFEAETGKFLQKTERISAKGFALTLDGRIVAATRDGFLILDGGNLKTIQEFKDAAERANATFGFEQVAVDGNGVFYALDDQNGDVCKFAADGKFLNRFKSNSTSPNSIAIDPKGRVFVSDTSRIHVFDADGKSIDSFQARQAFGMTFNDKGELFVASRPHVVKYEIKN